MGPQKSVWDKDTQEEHGGQAWRELGSRFICDFSVTTNALGAPESAMNAARNALNEISHYPAADAGEALKALSKFTGYADSKMLVGNGASEFIDVLMRVAPQGALAKSPYRAAYMEYVRAARAAGRQVNGASLEECGVSVVIHPNSPTGDCMSLDELREHVKRVEKGIVIVDESFIAFAGEKWRELSALNLIEDDECRGRLVVLFSWTKLWACPGLRIGSIAGTKGLILKVKKLLPPWSCNSVAQEFLKVACEDTAYMKETWKNVAVWKKMTEKMVRDIGWTVNEHSPQWVPWVFVTCADEHVAKRAADVAHDAGCPVRWCKSFGTAECLRLGVRTPTHQNVLREAWMREFVQRANGNCISAENGIDA